MSPDDADMVVVITIAFAAMFIWMMLRLGMV
jgi:hypothetical protein